MTNTTHSSRNSKKITEISKKFHQEIKKKIHNNEQKNQFCSLSKNLNFHQHSKLFWKSNAHTHTLNWCVRWGKTLDWPPDKRTNKAFLGVGYVISFACQSETIHAESSNFETHVTAFTSSYPPLAFSLFLIGNMKMGPTLIIQSCDGEHNPYFIGMMDLCLLDHYQDHLATHASSPFPPQQPLLVFLPEPDQSCEMSKQIYT